MREIKFRAWDKEDGKMFFPETDNNSDTFWCGFDGKRGLRAVDPYEEEYPLMQFTGLTDKNGKEIYEGDVVVLPYIDPMGTLHTDTPNGKAKIGFENGQFVLYRTEAEALVDWCKKTQGEYVSNYGNLTDVSNVTILEIIGNIYENPELLQGKS